MYSCDQTMLFQLNIVHKDASASQLQMLLRQLPRYTAGLWSYKVLQGIQKDPQKHLHTFQLFIHATETINVWSQQHSPSGSSVTKLSLWELAYVHSGSVYNSKVFPKIPQSPVRKIHMKKSSPHFRPIAIECRSV